MATATLQNLTRAGLTVALTAANAGGDEAPVGDNVFLVINNGGGSPVTLTIVTPGTEGGLAIADQTCVVAAGARTLCGPLSPELFKDPGDGLAHLQWSSATSVTFGAVALS
jgi:hypothetical protein